jgi:hypothetical protein
LSGVATGRALILTLEVSLDPAKQRTHGCIQGDGDAVERSKAQILSPSFEPVRILLQKAGLFAKSFLSKVELDPSRPNALTNRQE